MRTPRTIVEKIWDNHVVAEHPGAPTLIFIDLHLCHEVTTPQAFSTLRERGLRVRRPDLTIATMNHSTPTTSRDLPIMDPIGAAQLAQMEKNCADFGIRLYNLKSNRQGIVHVMGPEQGMTQPGMTIVCGDSHTATHGAFGALAFGIGSSEVEHVLATQTLIQRAAKNMLIRADGELPLGCTAKDLVLAIIGKIGTAGGTGHVVEYAGSAIRGLSMEGRMTVCNMTIEAGARAGLIAPDATTFEYLKGRPMAPKGAAWEQALAYWQTLPADPGAHYDTEIVVDVAAIVPQVTWGTSPEDVLPITGRVPDPAALADEQRRASMARSLAYMGLEAGTRLTDIKVQRVFIGSCTNGRIEDMREAARIAKGRKVAPGVAAMVVPGSGLVKHQAEEEGLDRIFLEAGFEWREAGCSMCLALEPQLRGPPGQGRAHPPDEPGDGGGRRGDRSLGGCQRPRLIG